MTCVGSGVTIRPGQAPRGNHNVQPSNKSDLYPWRDKVAVAAKRARTQLGAWWVCHDPVRVDLTFTVDRPPSVTRDWPSVAPDVDKLARAILDGLTAGEIWNDDGQCVWLFIVETYPDMADLCPFPEDVLDVPGVVIRLSDAPSRATRLI